MFLVLYNAKRKVFDMSNDKNSVLEIQSSGMFFQFYINSLFGWQELKGPYRNRFMKTPEDLIQSLNKLNWSDDHHYARFLTMDAYLELNIPKYDRDQDLCVFKLYTEVPPQIIVVKEKGLATYKELAWSDWDKKRITPENQDKLVINRGLSLGIIDSDDLIVHKDDLHEMSPQKTDGISPKILDLFYPKILFVNNAKVNTK